MSVTSESIPPSDLVEIKRAAAVLEAQGGSLVAYPIDLFREEGDGCVPFSVGIDALCGREDTSFWPLSVRLYEPEAAKMLGYQSASTMKTLMLEVCANNAIETLDTFGKKVFLVRENSIEGYKSHPSFKIQIGRRFRTWSTADEISEALETLYKLDDFAFSSAMLRFGQELKFEGAECFDDEEIKLPLSLPETQLAVSFFKNCGWDLATARRIASRSMANRRKVVDTPRFLVPGLVPKNAITLLAAKTKHGKSTLALELAGVVGQNGGEWCGFQISEEECKGIPLFLSGEDSESILIERMQRMGLGDNSHLQLIPTFGAGQLRETLSVYKTARVSLLVVDPARSFFSGDEDGSDKVSSELFQELEQFAQQKNCPVIVTHHLKKDAKPRSPEDVARSIRGSGVFLDRPRSIIALVRQSDQSLLAIPSLNGVPLCNFQDRMFTGERRLRFDDETNRHLPIDSDVTGSAGESLTATELEAVARACDRLIKQGVKIAKSGAHGLFEQRPAEIDGIARSRVRAAIEQLLVQGVLVQGADRTLRADGMLDALYGN